MGLMACGGGDEVAATAKKGDAFCKLAEDADGASADLSDLFDSGAPDAKDLEDALDDFRKAAAAAEKRAPKDIADVVKENNELLDDFVAVFEDNDFDFAAAIADPELQKLVADGEELDDELDEYLDEKCGIEPDDDSGDSGDGDDGDGSSGGSVPDGFVTAENFLDLYAIGAGVEVTDEMKECFADKTSDISQEDFDAAVNGSPSEEVSTAIGLAILSCDIPVAGG